MIDNFKYLKEVLILWFLFALSVVVVYYMPSIAKYPYFISLLFLAYFSKKDYWWLAFFVILFAQIGGLFPETARFEGAYQRIPVYGINPIRLPFYDLIVLMYFIKAYKRKSVRNVFQKPLVLIAIYIGILYIYSFFLGMSVDNHIRSIRAIMQFSLIYSLPKILNEKEHIYKLFSLLFFSIYIILLVTIIEIFTGFRLGSISGETFKFGVNAEHIRIFNSPFLLLLCYIIALFFFNSKENRVFKKNQLISIIIICFTLIVLTATRGWFIAFSVIIIISLVIYNYNLGKFTLYAIPFIIILVISINFIPQVSTVVQSVTSRLSTIEYLADGDLTAGGTLSRLTERMPRMLTKVKENPIIGFGFSKEFYEYSDNHVGPVHQLLQMGLIGIVLYLFLFYKIFIKTKKAVYITGDKGLYVFTIGIIGLMVIHFTSTSLFAFSGMGGQRQTVELFAILLTTMNVLMKNSFSIKNI